MMHSKMAAFLDLMNLLRKRPAKKVADPPAGTIRIPTTMAALPVVIWYCCSRYFGKKEASPDTMMASSAAATEISMYVGFLSRLKNSLERFCIALFCLFS